jgi:SAM-dependent methyltransferase
MDHAEQPTRWAELTGGASGASYAARFAAVAATGADMHGEATLCASLVKAPAKVLDAGCGTGRVAIRLAELGYDVTGIDLDASMLAEAQRTRPDLPWLQADLSQLDSTLTPPAPTPSQLAGTLTTPAQAQAPAETPTRLNSTFDLTVAAGNVIPLLAPGTLTRTIASLTATLAATGLLVTGFGLDSAHLPKGCPVTALPEYDAACRAAGLRLVHRYATWDQAEYRATQSQYAVSVHQRANA